MVTTEIYGTIPDDSEPVAPWDLICAAVGRVRPPASGAQGVVGLSPSMFGDELTCVVLRAGLEARSWLMPRSDLVSLASAIGLLCRDAGTPIWAIVVRSDGIGAGAADVLREETPFPVVERSLRDRPDDTVAYRDRGAELIARLRAWLDHGKLPTDQLLMHELLNLRTRRNHIDGRLEMPGRDWLRQRGLRPPHPIAATLALTFAVRDYVPEWEG